MNQVEKFINKFKFDKSSVELLSAFEDGSLGFSVIKRWNKEKNKKNGSLISFYVRLNDKKKTNKKPLIVRATYGEIDDEAVKIRSKPKLSDPIDLDIEDEFFYNIDNEEIYHKGSKISGKEVFEKVYAEHLKSTRKIAGLWLRTKVFFWRHFLSSIIDFISDFFRISLHTITGIRYSYEPFFETEKINGQVIKSRLAWEKDLVKVNEEKDEGRKIQFLGFEVKYWPIIVYSIFHALVYTTLAFIPLKPIYITTIFKNNFLTLIYVILTLSFLETVVPKVFIFLIKKFARVALWSRHKPIRV